MKIRFTPIRKSPDLDRGIKVSYAPAKRQAFRLRWYLIVILVVSPFVYMVWSMTSDWWQIEAPGYVELPFFQISAPKSARVDRLLVSDDQHVRKGQLLVDLRQTELETRYQLLRQQLDTPPVRGSIRTDEKETLRIHLQESLARYQRLFDAGAATRGELDAARLRLLEAEASFRSVARSVTDDRVRQAMQNQLAEVEAERQSLQLNSPCNATVARIDVRDGVNVQAGQILLTLQEEEAPLRIVALLPPRHVDYAHAGQLAWVKLAGGDKVKARVLYSGKLTESVPDALREFGGLRQGIIVRLELLTPRPESLKVNKMPVTVRFVRNSWWPQW